MPFHSSLRITETGRRYRVTDKAGTSQDFVFDDAEIKSELGELTLTEPEILTYVRSMIEEGIEALAPQMVN